MFYPCDDLKDKEIYLQLVSTSDAVPEKNYVPAYNFEICLLDGTVIGRCNLRVGYNDLTYFVGNIGYGIHEAYRGHHYAAKACYLLFKQAKKHQMKYVIISCEPNNISSARTCEIVGGQYLGCEDVPKNSDCFQKGTRQVKVYRVDL